MTIHKQYKILATIKTHTKPLSELTYERMGILLKETKCFYIFDKFRVKKSTIINMQEVIV